MAIFGPGLTLLLVKTKTASFTTLCCSQRAARTAEALSFDAHNYTGELRLEPSSNLP